MKKLIVAMLIVSFLVVMGCSRGTSKGETLVKIGGDKITEGDLDFLGEINPRIKSQLNNPMARKQLLDKLVEQEVLYREALKRGLQRTPEAKAKIELYKRVIIAQEVLNDEIKKSVDEYYKNNQDEFKKLKLSQIMVKFATPEDIKRIGKAKKKPAEDAKWMTRTEEQALKLANEIKAKLDKGEKFEDLAKEYSDDMLSKTKGGDLGFTSKNEQRLVSRGYAPLLDKAFTMNVGDVAGPIKTDKGYSIITVTKGLELQPIEEVRETIEMKIANKSKNDLIIKLKEEEDVVYVEEEKKKEAQAKAQKEKGMNAPAQATDNAANQATAEQKPIDAKSTDVVLPKPDTKKKELATKPAEQNKETK